MASMATITVTLNNPYVQPVTVTYSTSNGTATAGSDYTTTTNVLVFAAGQISRTFTVGIINDRVAEPNETIVLTLRDPSNATLGTPNPATLTILEPTYIYLPLVKRD
jgi:serralysin